MSSIVEWIKYNTVIQWDEYSSEKEQNSPRWHWEKEATSLCGVQNLANKSVVLRGRKQLPLRGCWLAEAVSEPSGLLEMSYILIWVVVTLAYTYIKINQALDLRFVHFIVSCTSMKHFFKLV